MDSARYSNWSHGDEGLSPIGLRSGAGAYEVPKNVNLMAGMPPPRRERKSFKFNKKVQTTQVTDTKKGMSKPKADNPMNPKEKLAKLVKDAFEQLPPPKYLPEHSFTSLALQRWKDNKDEASTNEEEAKPTPVYEIDALKERLKRKQNEDILVWDSLQALEHTMELNELEEIALKKELPALQLSKQRSRPSTTTVTSNLMLDIPTTEFSQTPKSQSNISTTTNAKVQYGAKRDSERPYNKRVSKLTLNNLELVQKTLKSQDITKCTPYYNKRTANRAIDQYLRVIYTDCLARNCLKIEKL